MISIDRVKKISKAAFEKDFVIPSRPVILEGLAREWKATREWNLASLEERCGEAPILMADNVNNPFASASERKKVSVLDAIQYIRRVEAGSEELAGDYAAGWHYKHSCDFLSDDFEIPDLFADNYIERLPKSIGYDWSSIFIAHSKNHSPLHTDSFFVSVWLAVVHGQKTVRLIAPREDGKVTNGLNTFDEDTAAGLEEDGVPVFEGRVSAGDILFIPAGWWHEVRNDSVSIAISNNFVHRSSFLPFEQQVRAKLLPLWTALDKLRFEVTSEISESDGNLNHDKLSLVASNYASNERQLNSYLMREVTRSSRLLERIHGA